MTGRIGHGADKPWSWVEVEHLRWLANHSFSGRQAAEKLGRSLPAVQHKASYLGVKFQRKGGAPVGNTNGKHTWFQPKAAE